MLSRRAWQHWTPTFCWDAYLVLSEVSLACFWQPLNSYMFNCMQHPLILTMHAGVIYLFSFLQLRSLGKNILWCQNLTFWKQAECWCRNDKYWFVFIYCYRIPFQVEDTFSPDWSAEIFPFSFLVNFFHHVVILVKLYLFIFLKTFFHHLCQACEWKGLLLKEKVHINWNIYWICSTTAVLFWEFHGEVSIIQVTVLNKQTQNLN